jgi:hypothetical protein
MIELIRHVKNRLKTDTFQFDYDSAIEKIVYHIKKDIEHSQTETELELIRTELYVGGSLYISNYCFNYMEYK